MNDLETLWDKIKDVRVAMLTTLEQTGTLRSRPMYTQQVEFSGELWFFTSDTSGKVAEIEADSDVNLAYAEPQDSRYISVSGKADVVHDRAKIDELWNPTLKAWFKGGKDDPHIALLRVKVTEAEYWDDTSNKMQQLLGIAKAALTGKTYTGAEHEKLEP